MEVMDNPIDISLNEAFEWFSQNFENKLENAFKSFWEVDAKCKLLSLSFEPNFLALNKQFFVTRLKLSKRHTCVIKLSNNISKILLDKTLGFKKKFDFDNLTDLEVKILTSFNCEIKNNINDFFIKKETLNKLPYNPNLDDKFFYLVFLTKIGKKTGNLILVMPYETLKIELNEQNDTTFDLSLFEKNKVTADILIGDTKLKIADINRLDVEDILVLENSNLDKMTLKLNKNEKVEFRLNPDPTLIINNENDDDDDDDENVYEQTSDGEENTMANSSIWDNILVDVEAQFEKVKLELGKVRRIKKGEVVEIADVFKNKVNLCVENKIIANGELVIINDKYGIKINEIFSPQVQNSDENEDDNNEFQEETMQNDEDENFESDNDLETSNDDAKDKDDEDEEQTDSQNSEDENFDYSDFDVDDEDI